jgi:nucleoside transporter
MSDIKPLPRSHSEVTQSQTFKLWFMMCLEFFVWGAWLPLIFGYLGKDGLGFSETEQTSILIAFPVAAIIAMFFGNQFADRNFAAEKFLGFSHLVGGIAIMGLAFVTDYYSFLILMWVHCLFYVPTISITNSIAFNAMKDAKQEFGLVRMGGTMGWIMASWPMLFLLSGNPKEAKYTYIVAGIAALVLAGYSLMLPHTPPNRKSESLAWLKALKTLAAPFILILWLVTMVDAAVHDLYFMWTSGFLTSIGIGQKWVMPIMSIGQIAEIGTMAVLGIFLTRMGWKTTMIIGILGHAVRFAIFAFVPIPAVVIAANVLHGICYAFFFATVYIFVDEFLPQDVRSSTQGLFNLMILGGGPIVARVLAPRLFGQYSTEGSDGIANVDYQGLFQIPCYAALAAALVMALLFWPPKHNKGRVGAESG